MSKFDLTSLNWRPSLTCEWFLGWTDRSFLGQIITQILAYLFLPCHKQRLVGAPCFDGGMCWSLNAKVLVTIHWKFLVFIDFFFKKVFIFATALMSKFDLTSLNWRPSLTCEWFLGWTDLLFLGQIITHNLAYSFLPCHKNRLAAAPWFWWWYLLVLKCKSFSYYSLKYSSIFLFIL